MTRTKKVVQTLHLLIILTIVTSFYLDITEAQTRETVGLDHRAVGRKTLGALAD